jgi:hypothetical protein
MASIFTGSSEPIFQCELISSVSVSHAALFPDDFSVDSRRGYTVTNTWTDGGVGQFLYGWAGKRLQVLTGNDIALMFSHAVPCLESGSFSMDFFPKQKFPSTLHRATEHAGKEQSNCKN